MGAKKKKKSISTRKGDRGETSLLDGSRTTKGSDRPEVYGTMDEAQAFVGLARAKSGVRRVTSILLEIQNDIFRLNAELACPDGSRHLLKGTIEGKDVERLDRHLSAIEEELDLPPRFVLYGELETSALLDVARAVVRRAERALTRLEENESIENEKIKAYINRLSDLLFVLARLEEREAGVRPRHPETP